MIIFDTCVLIFDALAPEKLSEKAVKAIKQAIKKSKGNLVIDVPFVMK